MGNFDNFWQLFLVVTVVIYHFTFPIMHPVYPPPPPKIKCMIVVSNFSFVLKVVPKEIEDIIIIIIITIIIITFIYKRVKTSGKYTIWHAEYGNFKIRHAK